MLTGSALSGLCMMGAALADTIKPKSSESSKAIAAFSVLFMFVTMGFSNSLSWPLSGEIPSSRLRVVTLSFATGVNYFFSCKLWSYHPWSVLEEAGRTELITPYDSRADLLLLALLHQPKVTQLGCTVLLDLGGI